MPDMTKIRGKNTKPEILARKLLHAGGFRFVLHDGRLAGKPDIVLPKYMAIVNVNGCFWHGHSCHIFRPPQSNPQFWDGKIRANQARDSRNRAINRKSGWKTLVVWECALVGKTKLGERSVVENISSWVLYDPLDAELSGREPLSALRSHS